MEYTKDMILSVNYSDVKRGYKVKGKRWTSNIMQAIRGHKFIIATVLSGIVFIAIDVVLINNFFRIYTLL